MIYLTVYVVSHSKVNVSKYIIAINYTYTILPMLCHLDKRYGLFPKSHHFYFGIVDGNTNIF